MNFLGHVRVALGVDHHELLVLGAILPDVESLMGQRLEAARAEPAVATGIALHHTSDAAFHDDPRFRDGSIALSRDLQARGVGRGPSRAVGHAGWELLLDGLLVQHREVTDAFDAAVAALGVLAAGEGGAADRLAELARRHADTPVWAAYGDPALVADRLHRQLSHRPLLAFPVEDAGRVTAGLAEALPGVRAVGPGLLDDVAARSTLPP